MNGQWIETVGRDNWGQRGDERSRVASESDAISKNEHGVSERRDSGGLSSDKEG